MAVGVEDLLHKRVLEAAALHCYTAGPSSGCSEGSNIGGMVVTM